MIGRTNCGSNSKGLRVLGGISEPLTPSENDVWINTSEPITSWQICSPGEETQISVNGACVLYAVTENGINNRNSVGVDLIPDVPGRASITLLGCLQYVNYSWTVRLAYVYHDRAWHQFSFESLVILDGVELSPSYSLANSTGADSTVKFKLDNTLGGLYLYTPAKSNSYLRGYLTPKIDVTNLSKIRIRFKAHGYLNSCNVGLADSIQASPNYAQNFVIKVSDYAIGGSFPSIWTEATLDVSKMTGAYYFCCEAAGSGVGNYSGEYLIQSIIIDRLGGD